MCRYVCLGILIVAEPDGFCAWHFVGLNKRKKEEEARAKRRKKSSQMRIHPRVTKKRGVVVGRTLFRRMLRPSGESTRFKKLAVLFGFI